MSKKNKPKAVEPVETPEAVEAIETIESVEAPVIPETPGLYIALSRVVREHFSVPTWITLLAIYTGCKYEKYKAENNPFGMKAAESEPKNPEGYGFYPNVQFACSRFGVTVAQMGLDYSKPDECIPKLKTRLPHITDIDYTLFMEAK